MNQNTTIDNEMALILLTAKRITATGQYHCFLDYSGHVERFAVSAYPSDTVYEEGAPRTEVMSTWMYLNRDNALTRLTKIRQELEALVNVSHCPVCGCPSAPDGAEAPEDQAPEAQS